MIALKTYRNKYFQELPSRKILSEVYEKVGGRLSFLSVSTLDVPN